MILRHRSSKHHLHLFITIIAFLSIYLYIGHHLWTSSSEEIKDSDTLTNFKQKIKS